MNVILDFLQQISIEINVCFTIFLCHSQIHFNNSVIKFQVTAIEVQFKIGLNKIITIK